MTWGELNQLLEEAGATLDTRITINIVTDVVDRNGLGLEIDEEPETLVSNEGEVVEARLWTY